MQRLLLHKVRFERNVLGTLLPAIAGAVNASGFFALGTYTSHMTGMVSRAGDELAQRHFWLATRALFFLASFLSGAAVATALVLQARKRGQPAFFRPLLLEAALLLCVASLGVGTVRGVHFGDFLMTSLICAGMGVQNALVTKMSGARIRTTHLTGVTTDIAIETTKLVDRWRSASQGWPLFARLRLLASMSADPEAKHLRLHLRVLGCFFGGATVGPATYLAIGHWAMLVPVAFLVGLACFDARFRLGSAADGTVIPALRSSPGEG
ncbi:MAG: YoaK family protein [Myxococcales bacterium]